jgi:hypothetical protein
MKTTAAHASALAATGWGLKKSRLMCNVIEHRGACKVKFGRWFVILSGKRAGVRILRRELQPFERRLQSVDT